MTAKLLTCSDITPQVKNSYVNFLNHCYVDTEVEMKEIYTSNHIWPLFEDFLVDMARVRYPTYHVLKGTFNTRISILIKTSLKKFDLHIIYFRF